MKTELQDYMERPKRYNNIDGTGEMSVGLLLLGFALLRFLRSVLPEDSMLRRDPGDFLLLFGGLGAVLALIYWSTRAIKKHITWPRTGYVAYRRSAKSRLTVMVAAAVFGFGFTCLMGFARRHDAMSLARMGYLAVMPAAYAIFLYRFDRECPWKWLVLLFTALGLLAIGLIVPGNIVELVRPVGLFLGLTYLASGAATLYLYIRHTHPPAPEIE
jgi:hypothetical protein